MVRLVDSITERKCRSVFFVMQEFFRSMAKIFLYVFFSLLLLPGCSGAQKPKVQELASKRISPPTVIEHFAPLKEKKVFEFVQIGGEPYLIRYNSRLPIVVYVPEGAEVRYRIWSADPNAQNAKEG